MNILYITSKKHWGGVSTWMKKTAFGLKRKGHSVWILAHPNGRFIQSASKDLKLFPKKLGMDYNPLMIYFLIRFIKSNKIDLVITNIEKEVIAGGIAARICRIPNVRRVGREDDFNEKLKVKWHHRLLVDQCIVPCDLVRKNAMKRAKWLDGSQFTTIYNGENCKRFSVDEIRHQRKKWGLSNKDFIVGVTSQLSSVKGVDSLIQVFNRIAEKHPEIYLIIMGEGKEKEKLKSIVSELNLSGRIIFGGFTTDPMCAAAAYDIAVSNSRFEGFPNNVVEYFAVGKPVVTTDAGGVTEMVKDGYNALLVPCDDNIQLYNKILFLIENPDLRKRLSQNTINTIEKEFSEDIMMDKLEKFFKRNINIISR
ncbi:MAG: glycosyltransferase family 4 protein [Desulfobacterales bacterium]